jgi:carbon storage regulator
MGMLILTRKSEESVVIGHNIEVRILGIRGDQISLGFSAPRDISIYRKEVYDAIQQENRQAAGNETNAVESMVRRLGGGQGKPDGTPA